MSTPISALGTAPQCAPVAAIKATALDYIEGWFEGDETRMERALWRGLAKRILGTELGVTQVDMVETTALELVQQTRGKPAEPLPQALEVVILDRMENAASVRVDAGAWIDYMHLAKIGDEWKIVNVLWERVTRDAATTEPTQ